MEWEEGDVKTQMDLGSTPGCASWTVTLGTSINLAKASFSLSLNKIIHIIVLTVGIKANNLKAEVT